MRNGDILDASVHLLKREMAYGTKRKTEGIVPAAAKESNQGRAYSMEWLSAPVPVSISQAVHYWPIRQRMDEERTGYLQSLDLAVLRFSNLDVLKNFESVCETIDRAVKIRTDIVSGCGEKR